MDPRVATFERYKERVDALAQLSYNYDDTHKETFTDKLGWKIDKYCEQIATEPPGNPVEGGAFERAREVLQLYLFPDPDLIEGIFPPQSDLNGRNMLLRAKFLGLKFYFGARINQVVNEERHDPKKGLARVWGYSYRTLEGHFEMGEIRFEIWKFLETGRIEFHINAYSKADFIPNIFYRLGFKMFGRQLQKRFARTSLRRMRELVADPECHRISPKTA